MDEEETYSKDEVFRGPNIEASERRSIKRDLAIEICKIQVRST